MTLFELSFALSSVVLGMALTHIAATVHKLLLAGRQVSWAIEPILLTMLVLLVIIVVWMGSWYSRDETSITFASIVLRVAMLMTLYFTAASCLPEPEGGTVPIDTLAYYDRTRLLSFGSIIVSYVLNQIGSVTTDGWPAHFTLLTFAYWLLYPALYTVLIFIRSRWVNIVVLSFALLFFGWSVIGARLSST